MDIGAAESFCFSQINSFAISRAPWSFMDLGAAESFCFSSNNTLGTHRSAPIGLDDTSEKIANDSLFQMKSPA
jgi:hypothetical protein